jgi:hypothetical protein
LRSVWRLIPFSDAACRPAAAFQHQRNGQEAAHHRTVVGFSGQGAQRRRR